MANERKPIAAGFDRVEYGVVDTDGYLVGSSATAPAAGNQSGSSLARLRGAKTFPISIPEAETQVATGDDVALAKFLFQAADFPAGVLETAVHDLDFDALAQGTLVRNEGDLSIGVLQPENPIYTDLMLLLQRQAKSFTSGSRGAKRWYGIVCSFVNITPLGVDSFTERQVATARYGFTLNSFDRSPWGSVLTVAAYGTERATLHPFTADNPTTMQRFTGNNTEDEFTLASTPVSQAKTRVWVNGVVKTVVSDYTVNTSTKVVTFASPPASDAKIVVWYEVSE